MADVVTKDGVPSSPVTYYEVGVRKIPGLDPLTMDASVSVLSTWNTIEYTAGVNGRRFTFGDYGTEFYYRDGSIPAEKHHESSLWQGSRANANLNASTEIGSTSARVNTDFEVNDLFRSTLAVEAPGSTRDGDGVDLFVYQKDMRQFELGADFEHAFGNNFSGKAIVLYNLEETITAQSQLNVENGADAVYRRSDSNLRTTEAISRWELNWLGWPGHALRFNVEAARNVIGSALVQEVDSGFGLQEVSVPGSNTRVQEVRGELLIGDTWRLEEYVLSYGVGAEASTISQSGDSVMTRDFLFFKPELQLTYSQSQDWQTRLRIAREVAQLNLNDFVSAPVFQDDDLELGNPELEPESRWVAELSGERRFGSLGVIRGTLFYNWLSEVQDLVPLTPVFEAPGNIGDGRRWGLVVEATLPLSQIGIPAARLDIEAHLEDSAVTDPVTGHERVLSGEAVSGRPISFGEGERYGYALEFRQDFSDAQIAWGLDMRSRAERTSFKVNELAEYSEGAEVNAFIQTTRLFGQRIRLSAENLLNMQVLRTRTLFIGLRALSPVNVIEQRDFQNQRRIILSISGSF
ncbi:MAG TPA: TonB-dependent receptor [Hyphomicrobiaceae bacterium]